MKTFLQDGKRRKEQTCKKTTSKKKRLKLDPLVGWGEGQEREDEIDIQNWLSITDRVVDHTQRGMGSGQMSKVSKWKQQKLSFTDQNITFKSILQSENDKQEYLYVATKVIPVIIITEPQPKPSSPVKITEPQLASSATQGHMCQPGGGDMLWGGQ
jgi:hypothetical protein